MKYIKIAIASLLGLGFLYSCETKEPQFGPGTGEVEFRTNAITVLENSGLFTIPLDLTGAPGGYPVTVNIKAEGIDVDNVDDYLIISSRTIKITRANNSYVQLIPRFQATDDSDHQIKLTIESINGASIGAKKECIVTITNVNAIQYGQYEFASTTSNPATWTLILSEGPENTYIVSNICDSEYTPALIGEFDPETKQLVCDGRVNGKTIYGSLFNNLNYGVYNGKNPLAFLGGGNDGKEPIVFNVNENWELSATTSTFIMLELVLNEAGTAIVDQIELCSFSGNATLTYLGETGGEVWPF